MTRPLSEGARQRLAEVVAESTGPERIPGMLVLVAAGDDAHLERDGSLSIGGAPVGRDSLFRLSSTTKPITGVLTLALAAEGLFDLDDPIDGLLPEMAGQRVLRHPAGPLEDTEPARRSATVRDLLTFTNGFGMCVEMFMAPSPLPVTLAADQELSLRCLGTSWLVDPGYDLTIMVLSQRMFDSADPPVPHRRIREVVHADLAGR